MKTILNIGLIVVVLTGTGRVMAQEKMDFYKIDRIPASTGSHDEIAPVPYLDGLVYANNRMNTYWLSRTDTANRAFFNLWFVERKSDDSWSVPREFEPQLATPYNDGPVTFNENMTLMFFCREYKAELGREGRNANPFTGLYYSEWDDTNGTWGEAQPFVHNDFDHTLFSPHLTPDGRTLYFAADFPDSRGALDIYRSDYEDGSWTSPVNLGDRVNSDQVEFYPFYHEAAGRLYFSSNGHDRLGGFDIFYSEEVFGTLSEPVKMPPPINTVSDEYTLIMGEDFSEGFLTRGPTGNRDIYRFYIDGYPDFEDPEPVEKNNFCYRIYDRNLDSSALEIFDHEWVINDTLVIPGHDIDYCFPGPGKYEIRLNVIDRLADTIVEQEAKISADLEYIEQLMIDCPDTLYAGEEYTFTLGEETYLPGFDEVEQIFWQLGDGYFEEGRTVTHSYRIAGEYRCMAGVVETIESSGRGDPLLRKHANYKKIIVLPERE